MGKSNIDNKHIKSNIGFDMLVKDVMTQNVLSITKFESIMHVADILTENNISGLPVVDKDSRVLGIITQADILSMVGVRREHTFKDLLKHMLGEALPERRMGDHVGDIMTSPALTIQPDANIAEAVRTMEEKRIRRLTVADDKNRLIGIITRADILKAVINKIKLTHPSRKIAGYEPMKGIPNRRDRSWCNHCRRTPGTLKRILTILFIGFGLTTVSLATCPQARAALGGTVDSIASDSQTLSAIRSAATVSGNYTVHELRSDANSVREYVSPSGIVFGVAWNGQVTPDLSALLGSYADEFQKSEGKTPRQPGRRHIQVKTDRIVVERWGHVRNLQGRAYVPDLIPHGVTTDDIK